jgi:prefoldin alpha subunit
MSEDEIRRLSAEYQVYELQLRDLNKRIELVQNTINEMNMTQNTLEAVKNNKKEGEFLAPIGSNSFIKSKFIDTEKVLIGLGANIIAEVPIEDAIEETNKRRSDFQKLLLSIRGQITKVQTKLEETRAKIQAKYSETQKSV